jgi:hypothetical protein
MERKLNGDATICHGGSTRCRERNTVLLKPATSSLEPPSLGESTRIAAFGKDSHSEFQRVMVADENRK